jgi:hypothetical protein
MMEQEDVGNPPSSLLSGLSHTLTYPFYTHAFS